MDLLGFLAAPFEFDLTRRALLAVVLVAVGCGALGTLVVLRGLAFIGDALGHCVVPGVVIGYLTRTSFELWGGAAALLSAWGMALFARHGRLGGDTSIAVVFTTMFALGLALISGTGSYVGDLTEILFGNALGVTETDLALSAGAALLILLALVVLYRPLVLTSFDPTAAQVLGLPVARLDLLLYGLIALAVVAGVVAVGSLLVTALLIVPAATARLLARQVWTQMALSAAIGAVSAVLGLYASYYASLASGGSVVLASILLFGLTLALAPVVRRASTPRLAATPA